MRKIKYMKRPEPVQNIPSLSTLLVKDVTLEQKNKEQRERRTDTKFQETAHTTCFFFKYRTTNNTKDTASLQNMYTIPYFWLPVQQTHCAFRNYRKSVLHLDNSTTTNNKDIFPWKLAHKIGFFWLTQQRHHPFKNAYTILYLHHFWLTWQYIAYDSLDSICFGLTRQYITFDSQNSILSLAHKTVYHFLTHRTVHYLLTHKTAHCFVLTRWHITFDSQDSIHFDSQDSLLLLTHNTVYHFLTRKIV